MEKFKDFVKPTKDDQKIAYDSYESFVKAISSLKKDNPEIEIEETSEKIQIPLKALKLLANILKELGKGNPISIVPIAAEMTTKAAAEFLGCSRPHFVKLLEEGKIDFTKIGKHRRVKFEDVKNYKAQMKTKQKELIIKMMKSDEELGLYDS